MTIRIPKIKHIHRKSESTISDVVIKLVKKHKQSQPKYKEIMDNTAQSFHIKYLEKHGDNAIRSKPRHYTYIFERYLRMNYGK